MDGIPIPLSALQHYAFCPRQCALIHNEQLWTENFLTAQGRKLGLVGKLDLLEVELHSGNLRPVEYKRGHPKPSNWDKIQLCAQALCLEEMKKIQIPEGALWYGQTRHRETVVFDKQLRLETMAAIADVQALLQSGTTPSPVYEKRCKACSLKDECQPELLTKDRSLAYTEFLFAETDDA